ncbi:hypothetical protein C1336_000780004 [Campylobacter jejuni subsp. jejuni 1336]|nr:hypothetical protein C1336_000780004 [Campylobacter jejuni subsp. jejuni 1336]
MESSWKRYSFYLNKRLYSLLFKDKIESKIAQFTEKAMKNNDNIKTNAIKAITTDLTVVNTPK